MYFLSTQYTAYEMRNSDWSSDVCSSDLKIDRVNISSGSFNEVSIYNFKHNAPKWRGNLTLQQDCGPINVMARGNRYGPYSRQTTRAGNAIQHYDPEIMLDLDRKSTRLNSSH